MSAAKERETIEKRLARLDIMEDEVDRAGRAFKLVPTGKQLFVRQEFVVRPEEGLPLREASDRSLPARPQRPPSTRLTSPRGIALRFYLTALFVAQSRSAGEKPANKLPLRDRDAPVRWTDLVATPAERNTKKGGKTSVSVPEKKLRQVYDALKRLAGEDVDLITLPNGHKPVDTYEGFLLQHERGAPYLPTQAPNEPYMIPSDSAQELLRLPATLFTQGWIHVLEDSELTMLLMIAGLHAKYSRSELVYAEGEKRLLHYGIGRDAYQSHRLLTSLGFLRVEEDESRLMAVTPGKAFGYDSTQPPQLHRFRLLRPGFDEPAVPTLRRALELRLQAL